MQFYNAELLICLWALPVLAALFWAAHQAWKKRIAKIGNPDLVEKKLLSGFSQSAKAKRAACLLIVFLFAVMALARPQWGEEKKKIQRKGIDILFLLDTSLSMLAEDVKPNRLEKAKLEIKQFLKNVKGDRVGMIAFAGSSFLQSPLTLDYAAFQLFLDAIKTGYIPDPGTSLSQAFFLAAKAFPQTKLKHKAVVLLTDGEDHEGGIEEALKAVKDTGIRIYTVGVGTLKGDPIPLKDERGKKSGFKKDRNGEVVITKLNPALLQRIAQETGGLYLPSTPSEKEIALILTHMEGLEKRQLKEKLIAEREDHYQVFLLIAFIFLAFEMLIRKTRPEHAKVLGVFAAVILLSGFIKGPKALNDEGTKHFKEKRYQSSLEAFRKAQVKKPEDPVIRYNLGTVLYQNKEYREAAKELEYAVRQAKDKEVLADALYNLGNTQFRLGNFEGAIESYKKTLDLNPKDKDAKYNLEFLQNEKKMFDKKNEQRKQEKQDKQQQLPKPQDQQEQKQQQQQQNQQQQNQQQQNQQQQQDQQEQKGEDEDEQQEQQGQEQDQQKKEDRQQEEQPQPAQEQPSGESQEEKEKPQPAGQEKQPLQGQMTMENALRILEAMKESERELQDLRRPPLPEVPRQVEKDW